MLGIAAGVAQWITDSAPQPILNDSFNLIFGGGNFGPLPGLIVWGGLFVVVGAVVLNKTRFGRQVLATGGNRTAAEFTGIKTKRIKFQVLLISATVASVAGMLYAGRLRSGRFQWGAGNELSPWVARTPGTSAGGATACPASARWTGSASSRSSTRAASTACCPWSTRTPCGEAARPGSRPASRSPTARFAH